MKVAKIVEGVVTEIGLHAEMFPSTSFSESGPGQDFLDAVGAMKVDNDLTFDAETQKLVDTDAYIDGDVVRTVEVQAKTAGEIAADQEKRRKAKIAYFQAEAGRRLDKFAVERGYGSIVSVCTYDTSSIPRYAADALRARTLRDQWWEILNTIASDVIAGNRVEPETFDDIAGELPALTWQ